MKIYDHVVIMNSEQGRQASNIVRLETKIDMFERYLIALIVAVLITIVTNVVTTFLKKKQIC
jgi:hypothetical protein